MDKKQLTEIIIGVYNTLTPQKVSVFIKSEDVVNVRVVCNAFEGMTFSARFKQLNEMLQSNQPELFNQYLFVFEAFTTAELLKLPKDQSVAQISESEEFKNTAKPLEP